MNKNIKSFIKASSNQDEEAARKFISRALKDKVLEKIEDQRVIVGKEISNSLRK